MEVQISNLRFAISDSRFVERKMAERKINSFSFPPFSFPRPE
jgi:hypothetical protein